MMKTKLQEARTRKGLSQEQVANLVGMTQPNYSRKESGITRISKQEWDLIAKKLEVELDDIYEDDASTIIYKNGTGNDNFNFGGTININIPDFVMNYMELLKEQNEILKKENDLLKSKNEIL